MHPLEAAAEFDLYPRRIFLAGQRLPVCGPDGFVLPLPPSEVLSTLDLLGHSALLVTAPPWTGKTFLAEKLDNALKFGPLPELSFGEFVYLSSFERSWEARPIPLWWPRWKKGTNHACWLIDAVDEDARLRGGRVGQIIDRIEDLRPDERSRLHLVFFSRLNEVPEEFLRRMNHLLGEWSPERPQGLRQVRLAGLGREEAMRLVGPDRFEHVCHLLRENGLLDLASLPNPAEPEPNK